MGHGEEGSKGACSEHGGGGAEAVLLCEALNQ